MKIRQLTSYCRAALLTQKAKLSGPLGDGPSHSFDARTRNFSRVYNMQMKANPRKLFNLTLFQEQAGKRILLNVADLKDLIESGEFWTQWQTVAFAWFSNGVWASYTDPFAPPARMTTPSWATHVAVVLK